MHTKVNLLLALLRTLQKLLLALLRIFTKITSRFGTTRYKILVESGEA